MGANLDGHRTFGDSLLLNPVVQSGHLNDCSEYWLRGSTRRISARIAIRANSISVNDYAYTRDNPVRYIDPAGLWSITFGAYGGVGGQITFGSDDGHGFVTGL